MAQFPKPDDVNKIWAAGGDVISPGDSKIISGWGVEVPPRQYFNYIDNKQDAFIAHVNQMGIAVWDATTQYQADKSYAQGPTSGTIYRCVQTHAGQNPEADSTNTYWIVAFGSAGDNYTKTESDELYLAKANNLAGLSSIATARTNLNVYSKTEVDNKTTVATITQAQGLISSSTLITPQRLNDSFKGSNQSLTPNGYQILPGGLVMQWCSSSVAVSSAIGSSAVASVTFPLVMSNVLNLQVTQDGQGAEAGEMSYAISAKSGTGASANFVRISGTNTGSETVNASFFVIGTI